MNNLITRARKEWCEVRHGPAGADDWYAFPVACPPDVVAALLDLLEKGCDCPECSSDRSAEHADYCNLRLVEAAIARALGGQQP